MPLNFPLRTSASRLGFASILIAVALGGLDHLRSQEPPTRESLAKKVYPYLHGKIYELKDLMPQNDVAADRELSSHDLDVILSLSRFLTDKRNEQSHRSFATRALGVAGHRHAIPALVAVLRDQNDPELRIGAVTALGQIMDKQVVDHLIEDGLGATGEEWSNLVYEASLRLYQITGRLGGARPFVGSKSPDHPYRKEYQENWRTWWEKNRDKVKLNREWAFGHS